ncbi:hypothetical protein J2T57_002547 [Natronocella acetinitrilica]|uniref:DUF3299 domain-containing protein n=1 Tax=Natronocella acetinitrilica TaxID=414046 RepID=A0AAE3KGN1_9GAMM|nr:DUF3299 domain-containing protein [Natronocella acetinitrilica]MCP1675397.1 hypothetical protein [Natronocella acetinitrilica]
MQTLMNRLSPKRLAWILALSTVMLGGCWSSQNTDSASGSGEVRSGSDRQAAPTIRVYMAEFQEFGEVVGITAASDEFVDLRMRLEAADGEPLPDAELKISSLVGNELSDESLPTDKDGWVDIRIRPRLPGEDVLTFTGGGISKQVSLYITDDAYGHPMEHLAERAVDLPEVEGVVPWQTMTDIGTREGRHGLLEPIFTSDVRELHGKDVRIQGFMLPLDNSDRQQHFLLSRTPPSCFYCLPGGPENVVEVRTERPVEFSFDPMVIAGRMELLEDSELGLFYRLSNGKKE